MEKDWIEYWEEKWKQNATPKENIFGKFVREIYDVASAGYKRNKKRNFIVKFAFIVIMLFGVIGVAVFFIWSSLRMKNTVDVLAESSFFLVVLVLALLIISKWLDIKKYQETWIRHQYHVYLLRREMIIYIYEIGEYDEKERKNRERINEIFIRRIIEIEDKNEEKFVSNMENKEVHIIDGMMDILKK